MRVLKLACVTGAVMALAASSAAASGSFVLTATSPTTGSGYAPTFTGNGLVGVRVPATGQGYAGGTVPAQSELAGFYAKPTKHKSPGDAVQQRANIPTWSTLTFADGGHPFSLSSGTTTGWRQSLDLHTGIITTSATWKAPDGHITKLAYQVLTDRNDAHLGLVQLMLTPQWSGTATVTDEIDGAPATLSDQAGKGFDPATHQIFVDVKSQTLGVEAAIVSQLQTSANVTATPAEVDAGRAQTIGQQISFPVTAGQTYTFTKYVGIDDSQDTATPVAAAQTEAATAAMNGYGAALTANQAAWAALWNGRVDVLGNSTVATDVNASEFYLWSNTRDGVNWSISPAGLSSNGYDGHIFWDAETWMYPSLLAQHPDLAAGMDAYRVRPAHPGPAARHRYRICRRAVPVGVRPGRHRADPATGLDQQRGPVRAAPHRRHRAGPVAVLPGHRRQAVAGHPGLAGDLRRRGLLGLARQAGGRRQLPHRQRHRPRRGEPQRQRRGVHQRRCQDDAPGRHRGGRGAGTDPAGVVVADRRGADGPDGGAKRSPDPSRVRRLRRTAGQAGRRDPAPVPVAAADVARRSRRTTSTTTCRAPTRRAPP